VSPGKGGHEGEALPEFWQVALGGLVIAGGYFGDAKAALR